MSDNTILGYPLPDKYSTDRYPNVVLADSMYDVHTALSNVLSIFEEYYRSFFPQNYFKSSWKNTQQNFRSQLKSIRTISDNPHIFINTTVELDNESFQSTKFMPTHHVYDDGGRAFYGAYTDPLLTYKDLSISFNTNYFYSNFEVLMVVSSYQEMLNLYSHISHTMRKGHSTRFVIKRAILSQIPRIYMLHLARKNGMDPKSDAFVKEMNNYANYPIIRVDRNNGNYDFYAKMFIDIHVDASDMPSKEDFNREEERETAHRVTDIVRFRYVMPVKYFLASSGEIDEIKAAHIVNEYKNTVDNTPVTLHMPYYICPDKEVDEIPDKYPGFTLSKTMRVQFESANEYVDFYEMASDDSPFTETLKLVCPNDVGISKVVKIDIYSNGNILDQGISTTKIKPSSINTENIYTIHVYVAMGPINEYLLAHEKEPI